AIRAVNTEGSSDRSCSMMGHEYYLSISRTVRYGPLSIPRSPFNANDFCMNGSPPCTNGTDRFAIHMKSVPIFPRLIILVHNDSNGFFLFFNATARSLVYGRPPSLSR